jgi:uncharacterized membrane protein
MNRNFSNDDLIGLTHGQLMIGPTPRAGLHLRLFPESISISHQRRPVHPRIIGLGAALLIAAFGTDLAYANSLLFQWENFSIWLLTGGLVLAALAGLALILDIVSHRIPGIDWLRFSGFTAAALLSLLNAFVHSRDAYTAVVPEGLALSAVVSVILVIIGRRGWSVSAQNIPQSVNSEETRS